MLLASELGAAGMNISRIYPIGRGRDKIHEYLIPHEVFKDAIARCLRMKPFGFSLQFEDQALRHLLDPRYANLKEIGWCNFGSKTTVGCFAGVSMLHINPNGDVLACTMLELPAGNVYRERLAQIWTESGLLRRLRNRGLLKGSCAGCEAKETCGGCRGRAFALLGDVLEEDPFCPKATKSVEQWVV
jgi:radical SAM protein with 4Fe4S-binding SPASM domain